MDRNVLTVPAAMMVSELSDRIAQHNPHLTRRQGIPILNEEEKLVGINTCGDVLRTMEQGVDGKMTVLDEGSHKLIVTYPDEILQEAVVKMLRSDIGRLPVVDRQDPRRLVGYPASWPHASSNTRKSLGLAYQNFLTTMLCAYILYRGAGDQRLICRTSALRSAYSRVPLQCVILFLQV
jgi:hypothetical protein